MFRLALLTTLAVGSLATYGGSYHYGLTGLLPYGDIAGALSLIKGRYQGISSNAAAYIISQSILKPSSAILSNIKYHSVPAISLRLPYLKSLFKSYPSVFYGSYEGGLTSYLGNMGVRLSTSALVDPLALTDYYLGGQRLLPVSGSLFNNFFTSKIFGLSGKRYNGIYQVPSIQLIGSRLSGLSFSSLQSIFQPIAKVIQLPQIQLPQTRLPYYTGIGSSFLPIYSQLGLPYPLNPAVCLGGFSSYLSSLRVGVPQFISYIKQAPIATLVNSIKIQQILPIAQKLQFVSAPIIQKDILPLLAYRYYAYPKLVRKNLYFNGSLAPFSSIITNYFGSQLVPSGLSYNSQYISGLLGGFDQYIHAQLKGGYRGKWWGGNLGGLYGKWYRGYRGYKGYKGYQGHKGYKHYRG